MFKIPPFSVDGKQYKTVGGLHKYLTTKHNADSMSGVRHDHTIALYRGRDNIIAVYHIRPPSVTDTVQPLTLLQHNVE